MSAWFSERQLKQIRKSFDNKSLRLKLVPFVVPTAARSIPAGIRYRLFTGTDSPATLKRNDVTRSAEELR